RRQDLRVPAAAGGDLDHGVVGLQAEEGQRLGGVAVAVALGELRRAPVAGDHAVERGRLDFGAALRRRGRGIVGLHGRRGDRVRGLIGGRRAGGQRERKQGGQQDRTHRRYSVSGEHSLTSPYGSAPCAL